ncbi:MAG: SIS domain-containing protein [Lachnospiraceae bacterium]
MSVKEYTGKILDELTNNLRYTNDDALSRLSAMLLEANHIFTAGAGRSGVAIKAFTNRLMHLGLSVSSVGEISSPHTKEGDLLLIGSGSGETESLAAMAQKAKRNGVKLALITMDEKSTIAKIADAVVVLPGVSPKLKGGGMEITSIQPMGSAFEQICFLIYDGLVMELMDCMGETSDSMFKRHADLE